MALIKSDRVKETSTSTGATTFALAGAGTGYRTFSSVCAIGDTFYYAISNQSNGEWEAGLGTYSALNTLTRTAVHSSSNSGNVVTFTSGTKEVFLTLTARHLDRINDNGQSTAIGSKTSVVAVNDSATLPDLDLQFSELKTLTAKYGPTPSYSRASTGRYTNASGVLTSAAVNEPRFDHVFENGVWVSKGLLIEEQRTNICTYSSNQLNAAWVAYNSTITASGETDPAGGTSAFRIAETTTSNQRHMAYNTITPSASTFTYSVFAKAQERNWLQLISFDDPNLYYTWFNLSTGVVGTNAAGNTATITAVGNGWYRCSVTRTVASTATQYIQTGPANGDNNSAYAGDPTKGLLVYGAQVELGSFPTSYIPTVASSVTRSADVCQITGSAFTNLWNASEGSFAINYDCPANGTLVQYQANSAASTNIHTAVSIGTTQYFQVYLPPEQALINAGSIVANLPQGLSSAYKLNDFAASLNGGAVATDTAGSLPTPTKLIIGSDGSVYNNGHIARLRYFRSRLDNTQLVNLSGGINTLAFKPVTGSGSVTVANEYSGINISVPNPLPITNGGTGAQTQLAAVTNLISNPPNDGGQYTLASKKTSGSPSFYWVDSTGYAPTLDLLFAADKSLTAYTGPTPSFSRASTGTFFNSSGVLTTAAVNDPRFNHVYNGSSWVSKGLLIEEQRTNSLRQSNTFNTTWVALDGAVVANSGTSPDGTNNAWKLNELATTTAAHGIYQTLTIPGGACTWSIFAKAGERSWLQFLAYNSTTNFPTWFNLSNGTIGTNAAGNTATITPAGNGWYRCSLTRSAGADYAQIYTANGDNNASYLGQVGNGIYIYGAQVETGSFPTSYIPTTTAAVTRSADVCQITGGDFSGFWNASEGSFAVEWDSIYDAAQASSRRLFLVQNSDATARLNSEINNGSINWETTPAGANISAAFTLSANQTVKNSFAYKINDFALVLNGGVVGTDTSVNVPSSLTILNIGNGVTTTHSGHIARLRYYPTRLPNATLQVLST